jgi:hypothetical protein
MVSASEFVTTASPTQATCVDCGNKSKPQNLYALKLNHMPGQERELAVSVAFRKQSRKHGDYFLAGGDDAFLIQREFLIAFRLGSHPRTHRLSLPGDDRVVKQLAPTVGIEDLWLNVALVANPVS